MKTVNPSESLHLARFSRSELCESGAPAAPASHQASSATLAGWLRDASQYVGQNEPAASGGRVQAGTSTITRAPGTEAADPNGEKWRSKSTLTFVFVTSVALWFALLLVAMAILPF